MNTVSIVRCQKYEYDNVLDALRRMFALHGGADSLIKPQQRVLLKPNLICGDGKDSGATTHPIVLDALVTIIKECKAVPSIGDSPAFGSAGGVAKIIGLDVVAKRHNVQIVEFGPNRDVYRRGLREENMFEHVAHGWQRKIRRLSRVSESINDFDLIINVPKLKAHCQMNMTAAVKNVYGFISGKPKAYRHFLVKSNIELFSLSVLAMYDRVRPDFSVVDAIDVMEGTGPRHGEITNRGLLFGGRDGICVDTVIAHLMGITIDDVPLLRYARKIDYGTTNVQCIDVLGNVEAHLNGFKLPKKIIPISFSFKTIVKSVLWDLYLQIKEKRNTKEGYF